MQVRKYGKLIHKLRSRLSLAQVEMEQLRLEKVRECTVYTRQKWKQCLLSLVQVKMELL
jgi:hypothetical protein